MRISSPRLPLRKKGSASRIAVSSLGGFFVLFFAVLMHIRLGLFTAGWSVGLETTLYPVEQRDRAHRWQNADGRRFLAGRGWAGLASPV
jgi:hypothetical protein